MLYLTPCAPPLWSGSGSIFDWPPGAASRRWLHQSLRSLDAALRRLSVALILRRGPSLDALRSLVRESGADAVMWNSRYEPAFEALAAINNK
jgi:deoxyribodipyrimidine photolyase